MQPVRGESRPSLPFCVQLRGQRQPPHVRAFYSVCLRWVRPLHCAVSLCAVPRALRVKEQRGEHFLLLVTHTLLSFIYQSVAYGDIILLFFQWGRHFAVQYCVLVDHPAISTLTWVTASASVWIFFIFLGQMGLIASETTTYEVSKYKRDDVPFHHVYK